MKTSEYWKFSITHGSVGFKLWEWPFYQKQSIDSVQSPRKFKHSTILYKVEVKTVFKFIWKLKAILNNNGISGGIIIPVFKWYYRTIIIKTTFYWYKSTQIDQWNHVNTKTYFNTPTDILFLIKKPEIYDGKNHSIFNRCRAHPMAKCRGIQTDQYLSPCTKPNFK